MIPERAISFMRAFKNEYKHPETDAACDFAIMCIERYKNSLSYKLKQRKKKKEYDKRIKKIANEMMDIAFSRIRRI